jgi:hypothetical protein
MRPVLMVVAKVVTPKPPKMIFAEGNDMVEPFAARTAHPAFRRPILPGAPNARADWLESTGSSEVQHLISELSVMVEQHVSVRHR